MTEMTATWTVTPRQDRLESEIVAVLRGGGTRSALREQVELFTVFAKLRGAPLDEVVRTLEKISAHVGPQMVSHGEGVVGESAPDRLTMMIRWSRARFRRSD